MSSLAHGAAVPVATSTAITDATMEAPSAVHRQTRAVAWRLDFGERFKSPLVKRGGCNMSPLLAAGRLVFSTGAPDARLAAVNPATGETIWTAPVLPSYGGSPGVLSGAGAVILHHHVKQETNTSGVTAISADTGAVLWQIEGTDGASGTSGGSAVGVTGCAAAAPA